MCLVFLSKILGDATEQLSHYLGERVAGLVNVTLSNLAELIIIYVAVRENMIELVQAGIAGSIIGNLLLVMGASVWWGCHRHRILKYNFQMASLQIKMLFIVCVTLMIPTLLNNYIPAASQTTLSYPLAFMLVGSYLYYYWLSSRDPRFAEVKSQAEKLDRVWSKWLAAAVLVASAIGVFLMGEILVGEIRVVAPKLHLSEKFVGFILLPLLGNIAEHFVAVVAAGKGMAELSLSIAVGSASQVGMVVAPAAVLFGYLSGNPVTLHFAHLPLGALIVAFFSAYIVLRDDEWEKSEGVMLLALYFALALGFYFTV